MNEGIRRSCRSYPAGRKVGRRWQDWRHDALGAPREWQVVQRHQKPRQIQGASAPKTAPPQNKATSAW